MDASYAARVAPATAAVFGGLGRSPFPRPLELDRGGALGRKVAHQLDVWVLVEIRVGMELARDQRVDFACVGGEDVGEAGQLRLEGWDGIDGDDCVSDGGSGQGVLLSDGAGKGKGKLVVVV